MAHNRTKSAALVTAVAVASMTACAIGTAGPTASGMGSPLQSPGQSAGRIPPVAACSPTQLFHAAATAEHFTANDPGYTKLSATGEAAGAYDVTCADGWAVAMISRPTVGEDDGATLFKADANGHWTEVAGVGGIYTCTLTGAGVPSEVATELSHGDSYSGAYC